MQRRHKPWFAVVNLLTLSAVNGLFIKIYLDYSMKPFREQLFLIFRLTFYTINIIMFAIGAWLSLVERNVRDVEAAGSNPVAPINNKSTSFYNLVLFLFYYNN